MSERYCVARERTLNHPSKSVTTAWGIIDREAFTPRERLVATFGPDFENEARFLARLLNDGSATFMLDTRLGPDARK